MVDSAENQLILGSVNAYEQGVSAAFSDAVNIIESVLRFSPATVGQSHGSRSRTTAVFPVRVRFEVHEEDKIVIITALEYSDRYTQ